MGIGKSNREGDLKKRRLKMLVVVLSVLVIALVPFGLFVKKIMQPPLQIPPVVQLTICTLSDADTERWQKVKKLKFDDATYLIAVEQQASADALMKTLVDDGTAWGYNVSESDIKRFNDSLGKDVKTKKGIELLDIKYIEGVDSRFAVADIYDSTKPSEEETSDITTLAKAVYQSYKKVQ